MKAKLKTKAKPYSSLKVKMTGYGLMEEKKQTKTLLFNAWRDSFFDEFEKKMGKAVREMYAGTPDIILITFTDLDEKKQREERLAKEMLKTKVRKS